MTQDVGELKENTSQTNQPVRFKKVQTIFTILQRLHPRTSLYLFSGKEMLWLQLQMLWLIVLDESFHSLDLSCSHYPTCYIHTTPFESQQNNATRIGKNK